MRRFFLMSLILLASCNENLYLGKSNMNTDAALYVDAKAWMSTQDWDAAIARFSIMNAGFRAQRGVALDYAAALAGKCGFDLVDFSSALSAASMGADSGDPTVVPYLHFFMKAYNQKVINMNVTGVTTPSAVTDTYCSWSQSVMDEILANNGAWNANEKFFVVMFSLARMGMLLRHLADRDGVDTLGDATMDATFDACDATTDMTDFFARQLVTAFALVVQNYNGLISGSTGVQLNALDAICTAANLTICTHTTVASVTANDLKNIRSLIMMGEDGTLFDGLGAQNDVAGSAMSDPAVGTRWACTGAGATGPVPFPPPNVELLFNCCP